jgi:hypothetical protein
MAEKLTLGEGTPEAVALKLVEMITPHEQKYDRKSILDLYAECLEATKDRRELTKHP